MLDAFHLSLPALVFFSTAFNDAVDPNDHKAFSLGFWLAGARKEVSARTCYIYMNLPYGFYVYPSCSALTFTKVLLTPNYKFLTTKVPTGIGRVLAAKWFITRLPAWRPCAGCWERPQEGGLDIFDACLPTSGGAQLQPGMD